MSVERTARRALDAMAAAQRRDQSTRQSFSLDKLFLLLVILYLIVPLGATLAFGLSSGKSIGFSTYQQIFRDANFSATLLLSLALSFASTILAIVLITPTAYWAPLRLPRAPPRLDCLSLVPVALPALVPSLRPLDVCRS